MVTEEETRLAVEQLLEELGARDDHLGRYSVQHGSTRVFIEVDQVAEGHPWVTIVCPLLFDVLATPELFEYVSIHSADLRSGVLSVQRVDEQPEKTQLFLTYGLLGTDTILESLRVALVLLANAADKLDDELGARCGGVRFHEP